MCTFLVASSIIETIEIDLGFPQFSYNNIFIMLLNYIQYKLSFTHLIDMYSI